MIGAPDAVIDFLDGLQIDRTAIIGNSMGGNVASRVAAARPERVRRLVTIGGVGLGLFTPSPAEGIKLLVDFVENPTRDRLRTWMESMVYDTTIITDEFFELRWNAATAPGALDDVKKLFNLQVLRGMRDRQGAAADSVALMEKIQAPTLLTIGRDDRVTPMDGVLVPMRLIKQCETHIFYNCGHWAMLERKEEFESVVRSFLLRDVTPS